MQANDAGGPRNLVVCCDGTNNTLTGGREDTNVLLLYGYLYKHLGQRPDTLLYYDPGVGSPDGAPPTDLGDLVGRHVERIAGLASGRGVYDNIEQGYRFLMANWRSADDRIFCFGFSRGAFTARCIVGMVSLFGMLRPEQEALVPTLVRIYFSQPPLDDQRAGKKNWRRGLAKRLHLALAQQGKAAAETGIAAEEVVQVGRPQMAQQVRQNFSRPAAVHWVGVWDTVESVGLPFFSRDNPSTATFHDKPGILNVRHALALDEHRLQFVPRLYDAPSEADFGGRTIRQLWFPGVHCDVGGSYLAAGAGLADASLQWMVNEVAGEFARNGLPGLPRLERLPADGAPPYDDLGMPRRAPFPSQVPLRHDALWDSPIWALTGMTVRSLAAYRAVTNGELRRAGAGGGTATAALGVAVDCRAAAPPLDGPSVWDEGRSAGWLFAAALVAVAALYLSGWNLVDGMPAFAGRDGLARWAAAPAAAFRFACEQMATWPAWQAGEWWAALGSCAGGLGDAATWQAHRAGGIGWAMFWDLVLAAALGYLVSRVSTRVFTFYAGFRHPPQPAPAWRHIGLLPAVAVLSDMGEDLVTLLAAGIDGMGSVRLAQAVLCFVGPLALLKVLGWLGCLVAFVPTRLWLAVWPTTRVGKVGRQGLSV